MKYGHVESDKLNDSKSASTFNIDLSCFKNVRIILICRVSLAIKQLVSVKRTRSEIELKSKPRYIEICDS